MNNAWNYVKNFDFNKEFACPCGCGTVKDVCEPLLYAIQTERTRLGVSFKVTSGGRCQTYNDSLTGSIKNSNHIPGEDGICHAMDFQPKGHCETLALRKEVMLNLSKHPGFKYAYCNGAILRAGQSFQSYSASWMGKSIHVSFN